MKSPFGALIFDLDGTLWDSSAACAAGWNRALSDLGRDDSVTPAAIGSIMGKPHEAIFQEMFPADSSADRETIAEACYREELNAIREARLGLYPGVDKGIRRLASDFPLFLASNCLTSYLTTFWEISGLKPFFKDAICHGDTGEAKDENLRRLVAKHRLADAVYIGDTAGDRIAAEKAGLTYFHVTYGFGEPGAEVLTFRAFPELVDYFTTR